MNNLINSELSTRKHLARVAKEMAEIPYHGFVDEEGSNLVQIILPFPGWTIEEAEYEHCSSLIFLL